MILIYQLILDELTPVPFVPNQVVGSWHDRTHDRFFSVPSTIVIEVNIIFTIVEGTLITIVEGIYFNDSS